MTDLPRRQRQDAQIGITLPAELKRKIYEQAAEQDIPVSVLVRRALVSIIDHSLAA